MGIGDDPCHGHAADFFQDINARLQNRPVSPELIDNGALDALALLLLQQGDGAIELGEHAPPVDIAYQQHRGIHQLGHAHIHNVLLLQIDFRRASRALDDDDVVFRRQAVVGLQNLGDELPLPAVILHGPHIAHGHAVHDHLAAHIGGGL